MRAIFVRGAQAISRKSRSGILICYSQSKCKEVNVRDIEALIIIGSGVSVEAGVLSLLARFNVPVSVVSKLGVSLLSAPLLVLHNEIRRRQYTMPDEEKASIMKAILMAKFRGLVNVLKYYGISSVSISEPEEGEDLLHWEAINSRALWSKALELLPQDVLEELEEKFGFSGRKPGAPDPFNKSTSLLYALLYSVCLRALLAAGLDPTCGLHHKTRYATPLVYDYSEQFKPVAIHAVMKAYRGGNRLEVDEEGELSKESINIVAREFFKLLKSRIANTRYTINRYIYVGALRLAERIRGNVDVNYTFAYNPKKLRGPAN